MSSTARRRWVIPVATLTLLTAASVSLTLSATLALTDDDTAEPPPAATPSITSPSDTAPPVPVVGANQPVGELADPDWLTRTARTTGIPERALASYAGASIAVAGELPDCGLGWNTLAAIGEVESDHGSLGKASLATDGTARPPIIGLPLDGDGVAKIQDTDRGRIDRDTTWDRAVGPMQFLPTTWTTYADDGDLDGNANIHDLDDAALAAARYLCDSGGDLTQPDSWIAAVSAYNTGRDYNSRVAEAASAYLTAADGGQQ